MSGVIPSIDEQRARFFGNYPHPYVLYERAIEEHLGAEKAIVDVGCGRTAPVLRTLADRAGRLVGVDLVDFPNTIDGIELYNGDIANMPFLASESVDLVFCRSVMEHVREPERGFGEIHRILRPGGRFIFLTANIYDYASVAAMLIPNRYHARIVKFSEGRPEDDTFPTAYKCNSRGKIIRLCKQTGFTIENFTYLGQYPNYFNFNKYLFLLGSLYEVGLRNLPALQFLRGWILADVVKMASPGSGKSAD